jgi:hypothetical protein
MAKKGIAVRIAIGKVKPKGDLGAPAGLEAARTGAPPARRVPNAPSPGEEEEEPDEDQEPDEDEDEDQEPEDQGGGNGAGTAPSPESLHYHDDLQRCDMCTHFGQDGHCDMLQRTVQAEGGCAAYDAMEQGGGMEQGGMLGAERGYPFG